MDKSLIDFWPKGLLPETNYVMTVARTGMIQDIDFRTGKGPRKLKSIGIQNKELATECFLRPRPK